MLSLKFFVKLRSTKILPCVGDPLRDLCCKDPLFSAVLLCSIRMKLQHSAFISTSQCFFRPPCALHSDTAPLQKQSQICVSRPSSNLGGSKLFCTGLSTLVSFPLCLLVAKLSQLFPLSRCDLFLCTPLSLSYQPRLLAVIPLRGNGLDKLRLL